MRFFYYFYAWIPFVALGTIVVLVLPWLAVIALVAVVLGAVAVLGSLAWGVVAALSGLRHPREQTLPSQQIALDGGVSGIATAFARTAPFIDQPQWSFGFEHEFEHRDASDTDGSGTA
jgi:hypothetical protein